MIEVLVDVGEGSNYDLHNVHYKSWKFPGGETGVQFSAEILEKIRIVKPEGIHYRWNFQDDSELILLANLKDALSRELPGLDHWLTVPYLPYARQDRACNSGESFALKVFAAMLNSIEFNSVFVMDVHSDASLNQIKNLFSVPQHFIHENLPKYDFFICPDKGASAKLLMHRQVNDTDNPSVVIQFEKHRINGKVVHILPKFLPNMVGKKVCIIDDICDGGATFISIAEMISGFAGYSTLDLSVTHGIFSKGTTELKKYFGTIYAVNLINRNEVNNVKELSHVYRSYPSL